MTVQKGSETAHCGSGCFRIGPDTGSKSRQFTGQKRFHQFRVCTDDMNNDIAAGVLTRDQGSWLMVTQDDHQRVLAQIVGGKASGNLQGIGNGLSVMLADPVRVAP